jgi:hypothetical protein
MSAGEILLLPVTQFLGRCGCNRVNALSFLVPFCFCISQEFDVVIEFEYSGGPGLSAGFCRKSAISFTVEILPSVVITQWHVLPAEM